MHAVTDLIFSFISIIFPSPSSSSPPPNVALYINFLPRTPQALLLTRSHRREQRVSGREWIVWTCEYVARTKIKIFFGGTEVSLYKSTEIKGGKTCHGSRGSKCAKQQAVIRILFAKSDGMGGGSGTDNGRKLQ